MHKWLLAPDPDNDHNQHVVPDNDIVVHTLSYKCFCSPKWQAEWCVEHGVVWIFVHSALDGRK